MDIRIPRPRRRSSLASFVALIFALGAAPALATYPGDNGWLLYDKGGDIWAINPDSPNPVPHHRSGYSNPSWESDGQSFVALGSIGGSYLDAVVEQDQYGATARTIFSFLDHILQGPALSQTGRLIYHRGDTNASGRNFGIGMSTAAGSFGENVTVTDDVASYSPTWSPSGTSFGYHVIDLGSDGAFRAFPNAAGGGASFDGPIVQFTTRQGTGPDISPDGTQALYAEQLNDLNLFADAGIFTIPYPNGGARALLYQAHTWFGVQPFADVRWSPDGTEIAFVQHFQPEDNWWLGVMTLATGEVRWLDSGLSPTLPNINSPMTMSWQPVDRTPPRTTIYGPPADPTNDATPTISYYGVDGPPGDVAFFHCTVDGITRSCPGGPGAGAFTTTALADGVHTVTVAAVDTSSNEDPTPASVTFHVDTTPPAVQVDTPWEGGRYSTYKPVTPSYSCSDPLAGPDPYASGTDTCVATPMQQSVGPHTFTVDAGDLAGNTTSKPVGYEVFSFAGLYLDDDPVLYLRLDDADGAQAMASLAGPDGAYRNSAYSTPFGVSGDGDSARSFTGRDGYGYVNGVGTTRAYTLTAFVRPDSSSDAMIAQQGGGGALWIEGSTVHFRAVPTDPGGTLSGGPALTPGTWHHVAGVLDGNRAILYVDGARVASGHVHGQPSGQATFYVGYGDQAPWLHGALDEVALFPRALSAQHILEQWMADPPPDREVPGAAVAAVGAGPGHATGLAQARVRAAQRALRRTDVRVHRLGHPRSASGRRALAAAHAAVRRAQRALAAALRALQR